MLVEVPVNVTLRVVDGHLKQISMKSQTEEGIAVLDGLLTGEVAGLPYCQRTDFTLVPVAAGDDGHTSYEYLLDVHPPPPGPPDGAKFEYRSLQGLHAIRAMQGEISLLATLITQEMERTLTDSKEDADDFTIFKYGPEAGEGGPIGWRMKWECNMVDIAYISEGEEHNMEPPFEMPVREVLRAYQLIPLLWDLVTEKFPQLSADLQFMLAAAAQEKLE